MNKFFTACIFLPFLSSCSIKNDSCEDAALASEQVQQCLALQRQIVRTKDKPILRTELERRYQVDCVDIRYYRDEQQPAVCGNKKKIAQAIEAHKQSNGSAE